MVAYSFVLLALAVSLDSFGAGLTYGIKSIKIPFRSIVIIAICSAFTFLFSMLLGFTLEQFISHKTSEVLGGLILLGIGIYSLWQVFLPEKENIEKEPKNIMLFEIKSLGIVIHILKKPVIADIDKSGSITGWEAVLLGIALSLDAFGAGIGAALIDLSPILTTLCIAVMSSLFLWGGMALGLYFFNKTNWMKRLSILPGVLLIVMGLLKM
ncbi:sporulation membrane protein YtaF [Fictibacillus barbaricus]|uniref:Sporulation membrane protein YtaF n=1 Tax=Fictibacillus barbaricus TaxID=182136 RepID=A0ABS2ZIT2_9BACL|nr:sporulation membrane protein YtaF [Fictibacillus barbaricus]MBN3547371.1 sporulation membrane protein YtaF [Fictibacillus barbaricus]GGB48512.1 putative membrane protein YtaF [Fictibacillus barbaricus]